MIARGTSSVKARTRAHAGNEVTAPGGARSHRRRWSHPVAGVVASAAFLGTLAHATSAFADPPFIDWPSLLPGLTDEYVPNSANECVAGRPRCVDAAISEMKRRFALLGQSCHHNAIFALAYLRTTQSYQWATQQPSFFADVPWMNHYDAVFAKYYFRAYDDYASGHRSSVPPAWLMAFDAAAQRKVSASGNLLLGMNAHVNRDLPFVLAAIGLVSPDGTSRKFDHDRVNVFLNGVLQPLLLESAARFDPNIINIVTPFGTGYTALFQLLASWRELAFRNAELLAIAPGDVARALVAQEIETSAVTEATVIQTANAYLPIVGSSASRDAYCAAHNGAAAPMAYAFGTPAPYQ